MTVADPDTERAGAVLASLGGNSSRHMQAHIDITSEGAVAALFDAVEMTDPASILVVASGGPVVHLARRVNIATMELADWQRTVDLNLTGVFACVSKFAQQRLARPLPGSRIVIIGSSAGMAPGGGTDVAYGASKAGVLGLVRQAALDLATAGITVNVVSPGPVGTPEFMRNTTEEIRGAIGSLVPLKRLAVERHRIGRAE